MAVAREARFHPVAWLLWLLAALGAALATQNPLYQSVILLAALLVERRVATGDQRGPNLLRWLWIVPLFTAAANALTIHLGESRIATLPESLPLVGGAITLEALVFGFASGYALVTLLVLFRAFDAASDYYAMLRLVPSFLFQAGLVTNIALAFVPQTQRAFEEIREAQRIRGHQFRGWRDLPPLLLPLLTMGLERSIQLAEAMESRGFGGIERGHGRAGRRSLGLKLLLLLSLVLLVGGITLRLFRPTAPSGWLLILVALAALALALRGMGRRIVRSHYRRRRWGWRDLVLVLASLGVGVVLLLLLRFDPARLLFYPYPRVGLPPFDPLVGVTLLVLALPALLVPPLESEVRVDPVL